MANLEGGYHEARMNGISEKPDTCPKAHCKRGVHANEAACKRVRGELNLDSSMDFNKRHGEEKETYSPKRLKGAAIQIPGGGKYGSEDLQYLVSDAELGKMCEALGRNWQLVGLSMGLESVDIEQCEESNPRSIQLQVYEMLRRWKKENSERATMCALIEAIKKNNASVSWNKVDKLLNEHFSN